ncbi:GNAT family N-acetyltransferase [Natronorubrum sp. DTA28]|uniref:GNAT family N-acetyltransferase n=1 Tax=Natronorubrum sp. DTA28 TaxID=3447019 RepID=UPI003F86705E
MDWTVRQATPDATPIVHEIARESWHAAYDDFLGPETADEIVDDWYAVDDLEASIAAATERDDVTFLLAVEGASERSTPDEIGGFAHAGVRPDDGAVATLIRLYARPDVWGSGAGSALLERVEADLRPSCARLRLTVFAANEVGVSFYESTGFDRIETRPTDLGDGLEECVYEKSL